MSDNKNARFTIGVIAGIILAFSIVDFFVKFGLSGENVIPHPTGEIAFTNSNLYGGNLLKQYTKWEEDYFFKRAKFEKINYDIRVLFGKRDTDGIYLGKHGKYFEMHPKENYSLECQQAGLQEISMLVKKYDARVMLVPTSDEIWKNDLPSYADSFDQEAYLEKVVQIAGAEHYVNLWETFKEHEKEKIYYDSDPHPTTMASFYAYKAWREHTGKLDFYYNVNNMVLVSKHFRGEYAQNKNLKVQDEELYIFRETYRNSVKVLLDGERELTTFYRPEYANSEHPFDYFLGNDFYVAMIDTGRDKEKTLVVIGDSYASAVIPFFAPHYRSVDFWNVEHYQGDIWQQLDSYDSDKTEVLLLQSVPGFLDRHRKGDS